MFVSSAMRIPTPPSFVAILLCCMYFCSHILVVSALCLEDQQSLLLQLKSELPSEDVLKSRKLGSWNHSIACCEWSSVTCDEEGHVTGLDLSGESISGGFDSSSSLFNLHYLENLNLAHNNFKSVIPSGFNKLKNLIYLNLSYAGFAGQIPIGISHLTRLVTLDISTLSELKLESPNLGRLVRNLTNIRTLYLDRVVISASGQEWHAAVLQIPTLQKLSMSGCDLSGPLHSALTRLKNLSVLLLNFNDLDSSVPESFANFRHLTKLGLASCGLTGIFPQKIFQVPTLSFIDISQNFVVRGSFPDFPLNGSLRTLYVEQTSFSGPLPDSISNLRQLSTLDLFASQFNGTLPNSLSNLTHLVKLDLSYNRFVGPIPSLGMCKKLQRVSLTANYFTGAMPSTHFEGLENLVGISLADNLFSGKIPSSIFRLPSLESAALFSNKFDGQLNDFTSSGLLDLYLGDNHLEGPIPASVFQLTELQTLDLSYNNLSGTIELNMLSKLGNLTTLDLSYNGFSIRDGTTELSPFPLLPKLQSVSMASCKLTAFPQFLKNQLGLIDLDLSNNQIAGTVPHWIPNLAYLINLNLSHNYLTDWEVPMLNKMSNLEALDLHSNHLEGPLPALPCNRLNYLDYSNNNLSSVIPSNIFNDLFQISYLSFSSNNLHGNIPKSVCNATYLEGLDLSNNALTGNIPKCLIGRHFALQILDLGRNKHGGTIDAFLDSCGLRRLHLNGNSLQGKLPKYLANCSNFEVLDVGNNLIHDEFPCWLNSISTLRVLILRSNKFHGSLKCRGTQNVWPHLQILDLASNNFEGKIPESFFETWKGMVANETYGSLHPDHLQLELDTYRQIYYQDRVTVTSKQQQMEFVSILTIFTAVDLSGNKFEGLIPVGLGQLNALYIHNLSYNGFSGRIPLSLGNLTDLESLDSSNNNLSGEIPIQLASLSFLSVLNLSYNHLTGRIPKGTQIQSFEASSFNGNDRLCGPPLTSSCSGDGVQGTSTQASRSNTDTERSIDGNFISAELGFAFGIGIVVLPPVFRKPWRIWYWERVDNILYRIFPRLDFVYERRGRKTYRTLGWNAY